ncbi:hypothetical protein MTR_1g017670 [Medicago truncatula]|uniref:Uncharacterized protein n=1 Tax=Medicago truncatula TaxID=3880 RepID=A0A072VDY0_MEDTR|nr:hypothetical protein MTR_1g017670 [Medicago truncatula]
MTRFVIETFSGRMYIFAFNLAKCFANQNLPFTTKMTCVDFTWFCLRHRHLISYNKYNSIKHKHDVAWVGGGALVVNVAPLSNPNLV